MDSQLQDLIDFFISNGTQWVDDQRTRYRPGAVALNSEVRAVLSPFFSSSTLDLVRITTVPKIENPDFYSVFVKSGQPIPLDVRAMAGITFGDVVLISADHAASGDATLSLLFHELVHVVQYSILGVDEFIRQYVIGWACAGFDYYKIPLEQDAYALQAQFDQGSATGSTEREVAQRIARRTPAT